MPESNLPVPSPEPGYCQGVPTPQVVARAPASGRGAAEVPLRDVLAFDAALEAAESGLPGPSAAVASSPAGASGSMAEMTAALGVYRDAFAAAPTAADGTGTSMPASNANSNALPEIHPAALTPKPMADERTNPESTEEPEPREARSSEPVPVVNDAGQVALHLAPGSPAAVSAPAKAAESTREQPAIGRFDVARIVQQVNRELGLRDLAALDAGREVQLRLDESILPETVLTFRAVRADGASAAPGGDVQVLVGLQTQSDEVRAFLGSYGLLLVEAMAREAPGLRWVGGDPAAAPAPAEQSGEGGSGQRQGGSDSDPGRGRRGGQSGYASAQGDEESVAIVGAAAGGSGLSAAQRAEAARAFNEAVGGRA